jgi:hypothetical protein
MKKQLTLVLLCLFCLTIKAQITLQGTINDTKSQPIPFASIALIAAKDSHLVKGALTEENGLYTIPSVSAGDYRILVSSLGFDKAYSAIFTIKEDSKTAIIDLTLKEAAKMLDEAVVTASRPLFEQKADRLVVNVANSPIAAGGTALEILQKVPGVLIIQDRVTLAGNQGVQVWIDGKPSPYQDVNAALRDMPGDQIDRIELIRQPGARYDAAGGPILNIILKRNAELGINGTAQMTVGGFRVNQNDVNAGIKDYYRVNPSLTLNYRSGVWNLFGNASYNQGNYFTVMNVNRYIGNETYISGNYDESDYTFKNIRLGADYYATKKTTLGILFKAFERNGTGDAINETNVFTNDLKTKLNSFITENDENSKRSSASGNFNIKHDFDSKTGHNINFDIDISRFNVRNINDLTIYKNQANSLRSQSQQDVAQPVDLVVSKVDYSLPIDTSFKVEIGAKTSFATIDNDFRSGEISKAESNIFLYKENINAGYTNINKTFGRLEFNAGLRVEQTIATGTTDNKKVLDRNYVQWFPNASLLYRLSKPKGLGIQASYSKRVNRPSFNQQNPFTQFIDSLTYTRGNPALLPEVAHSGQLAVVYEGQPFLSVEYSKTDDVIIENAPQLEGTKTFTTAQNLANHYNWTLQLNFPIKLGKWLDGFGGNQAIRNEYKADYLGQRYAASRWHWLAYWGVTAKLPKDFKIELNGFYMTKFLEEFLVINSLKGFNIGASKTFWDKRGRLSFNFNDIFYGQKTDARIDYSNVVVDFKQRNYSRNMRLTFSYQFGNNKVKNARNRRSASESETSRIKIE